MYLKSFARSPVSVVYDCSLGEEPSRCLDGASSLCGGRSGDEVPAWESGEHGGDAKAFVYDEAMGTWTLVPGCLRGSLASLCCFMLYDLEWLLHLSNPTPHLCSGGTGSHIAG